MTSKPISLIFTMFFALLITGCSALKGDTCKQMHFQTIKVQSITSITVHNGSISNTNDVELVRLQDKDSIANVFDSLKSLENNWIADVVGVPVGRYQVVFWQDNERLGSISFGQSFFVGQGCGYFFANSVGMEEIANFQTAMGIDEALSFE